MTNVLERARLLAIRSHAPIAQNFTHFILSPLSYHLKSMNFRSTSCGFEMNLSYYALILLIGSGSSSFDFYSDQNESNCQCEKGEKGDPGPPGEKVLNFLHFLIFYPLLYVIIYFFFVQLKILFRGSAFMHSPVVSNKHRRSSLPQRYHPWNAAAILQRNWSIYVVQKGR